MAKPTQRRRSSTRRWDIDLVILHLLKSGPKTASRLYRLLNPSAKRFWVLTKNGWKRRWLNVGVDYRVLMRHLGYLMRDGLITCSLEGKVLYRDRGGTCWLVKYYSLSAEEGGATPSPSPMQMPTLISEIHNPFNGEEGPLRYIRWLRDP